MQILTIEELNNSQVIEEALFEHKKQNNVKNSTYNSYRKNLNTFCIWLKKRKYIEENNILNVEKCKEAETEQLTLNEEQIQQIVAHIHDRRQTRLERLRNTLFINILRVTGARPCELLQLNMQDLKSCGNGYLLVIRGRKQKGKSRYYNLPSSIRDSFELYMVYRERIGRMEAKFFISSSKRSGWTQNGMKCLFAKLSKELNFKITAYAFRRFVATRLCNEGKSLEKIAMYLGHTRTSTTRRYIEQSGRLTEECAEVMGNVI